MTAERSVQVVENYAAGAAGVLEVEGGTAQEGRQSFEQKDDQTASR